VLENIKTLLKEDATRGEFKIEVKGKPLELTDMKFDDNPVFECDQGSVVVNNACGKVSTCVSYTFVFFYSINVTLLL
jgi:hypothetical protein